ncbi:hypothetical protein NED98_05675 [Sphingomonas sp. MMSM20]|nr:hypothetical protein [Sphingomonas lycopersici]
MMQVVAILSFGLALAIQAIRLPTVLLQPIVPPPGAPPPEPVGRVPLGQSRAVAYLTIGEDGHVMDFGIMESSSYAVHDGAASWIAFRRVKYSARTDASPGTPPRTVDLPIK